MRNKGDPATNPGFSIGRRALGAGALGLALTGLGRTARAADTIRFGAVLPLTGPGGLIGTQEMRGIQFAVDRANAKGGVRGHKIEVLFEDNQAKPDQSVLSFNKLTSLQHVPVVFTGYSGPSLAMAPLATRKKVLLVNAGAQADQLATASPYLINTIPTIGDEIRVLAKYLTGEGRKKYAVLFENDAAGISGRDDFVKLFKAAGGEILAQEPVQFGQTDYRPALLKLAAAKPEVMLVAITAGALQMVQQVKQLGLTFTIAGTTFLQDPTVVADPASAGVIHTQTRIDAPPDLAAAFKARFNADMEFFVRQYYNATEVVLATLDHVLASGKPVTGESMRAALFAVGKFNGLIPLQFTSNTATVAIDINEMKNGKDVTIKQLTAD